MSLTPKVAGTLTLSPKTTSTFGRFPGRNLYPDATLFPSAGSKLVPLQATTL